MTKLKFSDFAPKNQEMMRNPRLGDLGILTPDSDVPMTKNADSFLICVAGGASLHSAFMPSFGGSTPVSHAVELELNDEQDGRTGQTVQLGVILVLMIKLDGLIC